MTLQAVSNNAKATASVDPVVAMVEKLPLPVAIANIKRIAALLPNQWCYTMDEAALVQLDVRYAQRLRGPYCNTHVVEATVQVAIRCLQNNEEGRAEIESLFDKVAAGLENVRASFAYYRYSDLAAKMEKIAKLWNESKPLPVPPPPLFTEELLKLASKPHKIVIESREKAVEAAPTLKKSMPKRAAVEGLADHISAFQQRRRPFNESQLKRPLFPEPVINCLSSGMAFKSGCRVVEEFDPYARPARGVNYRLSTAQPTKDLPYTDLFEVMKRRRISMQPDEDVAGAWS